MQLSDTTLDILRNFSAINQNMLIKEGNTLKTISEARAVVATATIAESFPKDIEGNPGYDGGAPLHPKCHCNRAYPGHSGSRLSLAARQKHAYPRMRGASPASRQ